MALRLRREKSVDAIRSLTELSKESSGIAYVFIVLIVITGVPLGFQGHWWSYGWIWAAIGLLILTIGVMSALGSRYNAVRAAVGLPYRAGRQTQTSPPAPPAEIRRAVETAPALLTTAVGVVAAGLLLWLMILKPF